MKKYPPIAPRTNPIIIIDQVSHTIIKEIKLEGYITDYSSLCVLDSHSYAREGKVVQISIHDDYFFYINVTIREKVFKIFTIF